MTTWTKAQEAAFQRFLDFYKQKGDPIPKLLVKPFRAGFRKRGWSPDRIEKHRGLLPC